MILFSGMHPITDDTHYTLNRSKNVFLHECATHRPRISHGPATADYLHGVSVSLSPIARDDCSFCSNGFSESTMKFLARELTLQT